MLCFIYIYIKCTKRSEGGAIYTKGLTGYFSTFFYLKKDTFLCRLPLFVVVVVVTINNFKIYTRVISSWKKNKWTKILTLNSLQVENLLHWSEAGLRVISHPASVGTKGSPLALPRVHCVRYRSKARLSSWLPVLFL